MTQITPHKIQQQLYTRERRGIFRSTEGFDTIARSKGLDHSFIKKILHPFCLYDAPTELSARGEKDMSLYPDAIHLFHTEAGQTVLGRSIYQATDFTGLRSAFFTHNYVIPKERSEEVVHNYSTWLHAEFVDNYDIELGIDIPELDQVPSLAGRSNQEELSPFEILASLNINEKIFKQLLFAVMTASSSKKKVYVALDVPAQQISAKATQLLEVLYASLPYEFRRQLGFMTYANEPQSKKGIHLMFVERSSLRANDRNTEKDFTFDLHTQRVTNADLEISKLPYLDFIWSNLGSPDRVEQFYQFADMMLSDLDLMRRTVISSYQELALFFQIEEGNVALFNESKGAILRGLLEYISPPGALSVKMRLNDIYLAAFDREFDLIKQGHVPDIVVVEAFKDYYPICGRNNEGKIVRYLIVAINNAISQKRKDVATSFYSMIESHPPLSKTFFDMVFAGGLSKQLFEPYIQQKFTAAPKPKDVMKLVGIWGKAHPAVLSNANFIDMAKSHIQDKLRRDPQPVSAVNALLDQQQQVEREWRGTGSNPDVDLLDQLAYVANLFLLTEMSLDKITKDQLLSIHFLKQRAEVKAWASKFEQRVQSNAAVMLAAYSWFGESHPDERVFNGLTPMEMDRVQELGCRWIQEHVSTAEFERMTLAFYQGGRAGLNYSGLLNFVLKHGRDKEMVYEFMEWSAKQPLFTQDRRLIPAYASAIVSYFKKYDRDAFKKRDLVKRYFNSPSPVLKSAYSKAKVELSSPLARLIHRNKRKLFLSSAVIGVLLIVVVGGMFALKAAGVFDKEEPLVVTQPVTPIEPSIPVSSGPDVVVYAEQIKAAADKQGETKLVFLFKEAGTCQQFKGDKVTIKSADGLESEAYSNLEPEVKCEAVPETTTVEGKDDTGSSNSTGTKITPDSKDTMTGNDAGEAATKEPDTSKELDADQADLSSEDAVTTDKDSEKTEKPATDTEEVEPKEETPLTLKLSDYKSSVTLTLKKLTQEIPMDSTIEVSGQKYTLVEKPAE
ncbi:MAG TPA: glycosyltransferase [Paenibacillus sp.]